MDEYMEWLKANNLQDTDENQLRFTREQIDLLVKQGLVYRDAEGRVWPIEAKQAEKETKNLLDRIKKKK